MESAANDDLGRSGHGGEEDHHRLHRHDREASDDHQERRLELEYSYHHLDGFGNRGRDNVPVQEKDRLECARAEMGQVREENQMLKLYLDRMMRDYRTLQMRFLDFVKQGDNASLGALVKGTKTDDRRETDQESALVSLSLGREPTRTDSKGKHEEIDKPQPSSQRKGNGNLEKCQLGDEEDEDQRLKLGLECKFEVSKSGVIKSTFPNLSPTSCSFEEQKKEEHGETRPPSKADLESTRSGEDGVSQHNSNKRARVSVRARCDAPTMNDGCQWRKYGQKIAKGNPCPRAYYRCTIAPSCPVRKQVQRCADDMSILITTYEGTHNHPLPMSATAMASTTSAAAQMLLSGSSSSTSLPGQGPSTAATDLILAETSRPGAVRSPLIYLPAASFPSSCPTITLDLTSSNPSSSSFSPHLYSRFNPSTFSSTSTLSFNSSSSAPGAFPITSWGINNSSGLLSYSTAGAYTNKNQDNNIGSIYHSSYASSIDSNDPLPRQNVASPDAVAAATKAITTDPSFQSVLAAALRTIVSGRNGGAPGNPAVNSNQMAETEKRSPCKW